MRPSRIPLRSTAYARLEDFVCVTLDRSPATPGQVTAAIYSGLLEREFQSFKLSAALFWRKHPSPTLSYFLPMGSFWRKVYTQQFVLSWSCSEELRRIFKKKGISSARLLPLFSAPPPGRNNPLLLKILRNSSEHDQLSANCCVYTFSGKKLPIGRPWDRVGDGCFRQNRAALSLNDWNSLSNKPE